MASLINTMPKKSMASTRSISRRHRPILHTCATSMLGVIDTAYNRSQNLNGPLGKLTKRVTKLGSSAFFPFASTLQHLGLSFLSFTDDHILFIEDIAESVFPPSGRVFDKIDMVVYSVETIPSKFDHALDTFPTLMHQIPFLDWVVMYLIWWLNFLISSLTNWGSRNAKEKEIVIDMSCDPPYKTDSSSGAQGQSVSSNYDECPSDEKTGGIQMANTGGDQNENKEDDQMNTNETALSLSPTESFQSAQFDYLSSPSTATESFHETKSFDNIESPMKNNKSMGEKTFEKNKKKNDDNGKDELQILELLEAKWHL